MRIFISWSGSLSHRIASALKEWLPSVIQAVEVFLSSEDVEKGSRWFIDITGELAKSDFGIVCLTRENLNSPWILFEAGALSKSITRARVSPLLIDLSPSDLKGPLAQFQAVTPSREDVYRLLRAMNKELNNERLDETKLKKSFDLWWADLDAQLNLARESPAKTADTETMPNQTESRLDRDVVEEILLLCRAMTQSIVDIGAKLQQPDTSRFPPANNQVASQPPVSVDEILDEVFDEDRRRRKENQLLEMKDSTSKNPSKDSSQAPQVESALARRRQRLTGK